MATNTLDSNVEADCLVDKSDTDLSLRQTDFGFGTHDPMGIAPRMPKQNPSPKSFGVVQRTPKSNFKPGVPNAVQSFDHQTSSPTSNFMPAYPASKKNNSGQTYVKATQDISDDMIQDGAHVVFDWDNTLKLYNKQTHQLSCRVSREFLLHLKYDRHCRLYIISAIRPSAINLATILSEVDKLGLTDVFVNDSGDTVDGYQADEAVVKGEYAHKGNVIICGYDKAETFLKLSSFDSNRGDKVMFFDDEIVNIDNFSVLVPNSSCYLCE